jgi:voltage-gated potassium channel
VKNSVPAAKLSRRESWMLGLRACGQIILSMAILGAMYFLVPTKDPGQGSDLPWLVLELGLFAVVVAIQVPAIIHAKFPILRAAITLGVLVPLYLLVFARLYLSSSLSDSGAFNESLDLATALYFTVTVFATVGFGDIVAKSDSMRMVVTAQMLINLVVVGAFIRVLVSAARRGVETRGETRTAAAEGAHDPPDAATSSG